MGVSIPETFPVTVRSTRFWGKSLRGRLWRQIPTQAERRFQPLFKPDAAFFQEPLIRKSLTLNLSYARVHSCQDPSVQVLCFQVPPCPSPPLPKTCLAKIAHPQRACPIKIPSARQSSGYLPPWYFPHQLRPFAARSFIACLIFEIVHAPKVWSSILPMDFHLFQQPLLGKSLP